MTAKRIVLHFDLNRTVLMSDAAGGRTMENTVNYLLSECTWGYIHPQDTSKWVCVSEESSITPPKAPVVDINGQSHEPHLITYKQFVDDRLPYKSLKDADASAASDIKAFNKSAKKERTALQSAFTGTDGPGQQVVRSFDEVMDKLHFPEGTQRDSAKELAASLPKSKLQEAWSQGRYYLLPSFLHFLFYLSQTPDDIDVKLVFRTFGDDLVDVGKELELLVSGKHPHCPDERLPAHFQLDTTSAACVGTFHRHGYDSHGTQLALGTLEKAPADTTDVSSFYSSDVQVVNGYQEIYDKLETLLDGHKTLALRDYWEWWSAHAEGSAYGKLLLVDPSSKDLTVFFDDHVEAHDAHIVDVRDVRTGASIPFEESKDKYLERVEPFAAITDRNYFINKMKQLE